MMAIEYNFHCTRYRKPYHYQKESFKRESWSLEDTKGGFRSTSNYLRKMKNIATKETGVLSVDRNDEEEKRAVGLFQAREEEIAKKKMQVREKVEFQLCRAEEKTRRLARVWEELEVLTDPTRKEVATMRKKVDTANRELRSLAQSCQKKEKEYREAMEAFHQKNNQKNQLTITLVELVKESEKARMKKLEELSKIMDSSS